MPSRPQFSLRMLLLVVVTASLIAATVAPAETAAPATLIFQGRSGPQPMSVGEHVQGALRLAMCVALSAMLVAGLVQPRKHLRTLNRGNIFGQFRPVIFHRYSFAAAWVFAPIFGLACAIFHRLSELGDAQGKAPANPSEKRG